MEDFALHPVRVTLRFEDFDRVVNELNEKFKPGDDPQMDRIIRRLLNQHASMRAKFRELARQMEDGE